MTLLRASIRALCLTAGLWLLTVVIYPLPLLLVGQGLFPAQANGSLLRVDGAVVGSALIGQPFASPRYFHGRPSAADYSTGKGAPTSSPSNLGPTNPALAERIAASARQLRDAGLDRPAPDLLYASGSGLDPHISPLAARQQIYGVANARGISAGQLERLVRQHTEGRFLGIVGEPRVNVLRLNLALDAAATGPPGR
ncbi:MAG: potassium-transporting ATPase subunit C [Cyanobium sp. CACIAM 14]|nr:MAG: potassium-transporting ATPase subunit C [Cyanobium sp. CACIAM 14]